MFATRSKRFRLMLVLMFLEVMLGGVIYATDDQTKLALIWVVQLVLVIILILALRATLRARNE